MKANTVTWLALLSLVLVTSTFASAEKPFMRVLDVGTGECVVLRPPGRGCMVYDTGDSIERNAVMAGLEGMVPANNVIDLLVVSHNDSDHIGNVPAVLAKYEVKTVVWVGDDRSPEEKATNSPRTEWYKANAAIQREGATVFDLAVIKRVEALPSRTITVGDANVFFVAGFGVPEPAWKFTAKDVRRNSVSIVVRVTCQNSSVLLCGDAIGRTRGKTATTPAIGTERYMIDHAASATIDSDVIVAPHHGGDNANSSEFIAAVTPRWVIFSAGHFGAHSLAKKGYFHPMDVAVKRYLEKRIPEDRIFRTDLGDNEGAQEWQSDPANQPPDLSGDDDVDIVLGTDGTVSLAYAEDLRWGPDSARAALHRGW